MRQEENEDEKEKKREKNEPSNKAFGCNASEINLLNVSFDG